MDRIEPPFPRTICACESCVACCRRQPASLIPGDAERIAEHLGEPVEPYLWASPGARLLYRGTELQVGTITPRMQDGACVFLSPEGRCTVHPVSPAGCAYFDPHMGPVEGQRRSLWIVKQQMTKAYQEYRATLPLATSYRPRRF
jgi:Fe-S-cluster containining protein